MRIERVEIERFGRLTDYDTGTSPLGQFVVVHGHNDSGKSSLLEFLLAMLFGFDESDESRGQLGRGSAPHSLGSGGAGAVTVRGADGRAMHLHRRSDATAKAVVGECSSHEQRRQLGNAPLPLVAPLDRDLFRSVYAPYGHRTAGADGAWRALRDRLATGGAVMEPIERVLGELEDESMREARNTRLHDLDGAILELRRAIVAAEARQQRCAALEQKLAHLAEVRAAREEQRRTLGHRLRRARRLGPFVRVWRQIESARRAAGPVSVLARFPQNPARRLQSWQRSLADGEALRARKEARDVELQKIRGHFGDAARARLEVRTELTRQQQRLALLEPARRDLEAAQSQWRRAQQRRIEAHRKLLTTAPESGTPRQVVDLDCDALLVEQSLWRQRWQEQQQAAASLDAQRADEPSAPPPKPRSIVASGVAALLAGLTGAGTLMGGSSVIGAIATTVALAALAANIAARRLWRDRVARAGVAHEHWQGVVEERRQSAEAALEAVTQQHRRLREPLQALPLRPQIMESPEPQLIADLCRLRAAYREDRRGEEHVQELRRRERELDDELREFCHQQRLDSSDLGTALTTLATEVENALAQQARAEQAAAEQRELAREIGALRDLATRTAERHDGLVRELRLQFGDDLEAACTLVADRYRHFRNAEILEAHLRHDEPRWNDLATELQVAESRGERWLRDVGAIEGLERELQAAEEDMNTIVEQLFRTRHELEILHRSLHSHGLEQRLTQLRAERERLAEQIDRTRVIATLVRRGGANFRERQQPTILQRASQIVREITGGLYEHLFTDAEDGHEALRLRGAATPTVLPLAAPVGEGTREQVLFALRIAVAEQLDPAGERLPLLLEESFLAWDRVRRQRGVALLRRLSQQRQVILFTVEPLAIGVEPVRGRRRDRRGTSTVAAPTTAPTTTTAPHPTASEPGAGERQDVTPLHSGYPSHAELAAELRALPSAPAPQRDLLTETLQLLQAARANDALLDQIVAEALGARDTDPGYLRRLLRGADREITERLHKNAHSSD